MCLSTVLNELRNLFWIFFSSYEELVEELENVNLELDIDEFDIAFLSLLEAIQTLSADGKFDELINKYLSLLIKEPKAVRLFREAVTEKLREKEEREILRSVQEAIANGETDEVYELIEETASFIRKWQNAWSKKRDHDCNGLYI
ncbi:MAG: hypothetical protein ACTSWP_07285 [Candidatus Freyarchaeota archaeon]|nr:hypothetical protein [Candidatus Freyrarchaeum guaymaensis]